MTVDLRAATVRDLAKAIFDHPPSTRPDSPWYFGDVKFTFDPNHQVELIAELFHGAPALFDEYQAPQVEEGLWCMMGGVHREAFGGLIWSPAVPLPARLRLIEGVFTLYDRVLAAYPYESIDFDHPDAERRRFQAIDYMIPDLLLKSPWEASDNSSDAQNIEQALFDLFSRLLAHEGPVAQYAALHGLGHLAHPLRSAVIDRYLEGVGWVDPAQREYAEDARRGDVL